MSTSENTRCLLVGDSIFAIRLAWQGKGSLVSSTGAARAITANSALAQPGQSPQTQPRGRRVPARHAPTQSRPEPRGNVPVPERGTGNRGRSLHCEWLLSTSGGADRLAAASGTGTNDDLG